MPHAPGMHQKFPKCGDCHNIAHDLNNWKSQQGPKTPAAPKTQPAAKTTQGTKK
jgi:hypothetical protein